VEQLNNFKHMPDFTKLAAYLDSFDKNSADYDTVCFIKSKIAEDLKDTSTINNGEADDLTDNDVTMATPEQQSQENTEGAMMGGAFKELDVLNQLQKEKEEVKMPDSKDKDDNTTLNVATEEAFGDNVLNNKHASLFEVLQKKLKK
jgi:hypothetical protein